MFQPPEATKPCPYCGNEDARLILDFDQLLPELDRLGYPQYYCVRCANRFTVLDSPRDEERGEETP